MEIKRSELNKKVRQVFESAASSPVFISHYNEITTVLISKKQYDEWKEAADREKGLTK